MNKKNILICILVFTFRAELKSQVVFVNLVSNHVCDDDEIPPNSHIDIDISHLPPPCYGFDYLDNLNLDLVFEDNFDGPIMDLSKWIGTLAQHSKKFNDGTKAPGILDYFDGPGLTGLPENFDLSSPGYLKLITKEVPEFLGTVFGYHDGDNPPPGSGDCNGSITPDFGNCLLNQDGFPNRRKFNFTSGYLESQRNFKYGYFEMRCNIPSIHGIFPAFWLYHVEGGNRTEIDIFEFNQPKGTILCSPEVGIGDRKMFLTYFDWQGEDIYDPDDKLCSSVDAYLYNAIGENINYTNAWHTYALYWDEFKLVWFLDGAPIRIVYQYLAKESHLLGSTLTAIQNCEDLYNAASDEDIEVLTNYYWPDEQSKLIVDMTVSNFGGLYNPNPSLDHTCANFTGTKEMIIDYIRVYGIRACNNSGTIYYCSDDPGNVQSYLTATDKLVISPGCEVTVRDYRQDALAWGDNSQGHYMDVVAGEEITMLPGFWAQSGSEFRASIQDCATADLRTTSTGNNILSSQQIKDQIKLADKLAQQKDSVQNKKAEPSSIFEVFPNPTTGTIQFQLNESFSTAQILDITGALVLDFSNQINNKTGLQTINLASLSKGVYVLRISNSEKTFLSKKIILN